MRVWVGFTDWRKMVSFYNDYRKKSGERGKKDRKLLEKNEGIRNGTFFPPLLIFLSPLGRMSVCHKFIYGVRTLDDHMMVWEALRISVMSEYISW